MSASFRISQKWLWATRHYLHFRKQQFTRNLLLVYLSANRKSINETAFLKALCKFHFSQDSLRADKTWVWCDPLYVTQCSTLKWLNKENIYHKSPVCHYLRLWACNKTFNLLLNPYTKPVSIQSLIINRILYMLHARAL